MSTPANDRDSYRWEHAADHVYDPADDQPSDPDPVAGHTGPLDDATAYFWGLDPLTLRSLTDRINEEQP